MEIASLFDEPFPQEPQPMEAILREVENNIFANSTLYLTPRFLGYINAGGNQASVLGELLASAVNQICAMWHFSPAASEVERRVIRWIAQFIGYAPETGGCLLEKDGRVFLSGTKIHGKRALRACSVNHRLRREDVDFLLDVIREVGRLLIGKAQSA